MTDILALLLIVALAGSTIYLIAVDHYRELCATDDLVLLLPDEHITGTPVFGDLAVERVRADVDGWGR